MFSSTLAVGALVVMRFCRGTHMDQGTRTLGNADAPVAVAPTSEGWSSPWRGVQIKLSTDRPSYRHGEHIDLTLSYRNLDSGPWVLSMSPYLTPPLGQSADAPLYGLSTLTLTRVGAPGEWTLVAVASNRFLLDGLERLDPGAVKNTHGALMTWAWRLAGEKRDTSPTLALVPGTYSIVGRYDPRELAQRGAGVDTDALELERLQSFFVGVFHGVDAFVAAHFVGISYRDAELIRDSGYRVWSGTLETPAAEFIIEP